MMRDITALYQDVEDTEDRIADKQYLLRLLQAGHANEPYGSRLRAKLARDIEREIAALGALRAKRDGLRAEISRLRRDFERRGWRQCTACREYKPPDAFGPEPRVQSGLNARCRVCRNTYLRCYRKKRK